MIGYNTEVSMGEVGVVITNGGNHSPEDWAALAVDKIIKIGDKSHPAVQAQAHAFREHIQQVIAYYIKQAVDAERSNFLK